MKRMLLGIFIVIVCSAGCSKSATKRVFDGQKDIENYQSFTQSIDVCRGAVKRAFLKKRFYLDEEQSIENRFRGSRHHQEGKQTITISLEAILEPMPAGGTTIFLNAVETRTRTYVRSHRRFVCWIIPLPFGAGKTATEVQESEQSITDKKFYKNFLDTITKEMQP